MQTRYVTAPELKAMIGDEQELALLDVREEGKFSKRHLLLACSVPLSRLEMRMDALVPRRSVRMVLMDEGDGLALRAAAKLAHFGYSDVSILAGGVDAWQQAGYEVYSGVNVPSKAFGEFVEHHEGTPRMEAAEIKAMVEAGEPVVILDSRPLPEYRRMSIPGGIDCPGAELVYRVHDMVKSADTLVVVNCAGRTRSIIGAQSLINAGIANRVVALKNGTMGWHLAGFELAHGADRLAPRPSKAGLAQAKQAAARVAKRFGVQTIDVNQVRELAKQMQSRSLYLLDVRSPEEFEAGHLACTVNAPGGQLVQATDTYVGTRNARILLIDDNGVRATMTASWLIQMGWEEVYVVKNALASGPLLEGPAPIEVLGLQEAAAPTLSAQQLNELLESREAEVVDLETSLRYRDGHIPGAWFAIRSRFADSLAKLPPTRMLVLTSPDGSLAKLAAVEAAQIVRVAVKALHGGTQAWQAAGWPLARGLDRMLDEADDAWYKPYDRNNKVEEAMQQYLTWEIDLVKQIERDGDARFRRFAAG